MKNRERNSLLQPQLFPVSEELITIELNEALETQLSYQVTMSANTFNLSAPRDWRLRLVSPRERLSDGGAGANLRR